MENKQEFWQLFAQTGDPLAYVLYRGACAQSRREPPTWSTQMSKPS